MRFFKQKQWYNLTLSSVIYSLVGSILIMLTYNLVTSSKANSASTVLLPESYYTDLYQWNKQGGLQQTKLGRGINLGNYLDAPAEGKWTGNRLLVKEDLQRIAEAGFKTVRIPIRWSAHADIKAPYTINSNFMARVKEVIKWADDADLKVVLNVHHYDKLMKDSKGKHEGHIRRLESFWEQISQQFPLSEYPSDALIFELLNEPHGDITIDSWNAIIPRLLTIIWDKMATQQNTGTSQRIVMIGTADWNVPGYLPRLKLPKSVNPSNTIITFHYYKPFHFTHQGANWVGEAKKWIGTTWLGTKSEQDSLIEVLDKITNWNSRSDRGYEFFMGEFGVYSKYSEPEQQRAWTAFMTREAEKRNISWAYWEYAAGFGAYDPNKKEWRPQLINALIPEKNNNSK